MTAVNLSKGLLAACLLSTAYYMCILQPGSEATDIPRTNTTADPTADTAINTTASNSTADTPATGTTTDSNSTSDTPATDATTTATTVEVQPPPVEEGLSGGEIAGITIGSIAGVAAVGGGIFAALKYTGRV